MQEARYSKLNKGKELVSVMPEDSPSNCAAHDNVIVTPGRSCWCQCVATQPGPGCSLHCEVVCFRV